MEPNEREDPRPTDAIDPRKNYSSLPYHHGRPGIQRRSGIRRGPRHHPSKDIADYSGIAQGRRSGGRGNSQENHLPEKGSPRRKRRVGPPLPQILCGGDASHGHRARAEFIDFVASAFTPTLWTRAHARLQVGATWTNTTFWPNKNAQTEFCSTKKGPPDISSGPLVF